jgi:hypothetical protein
MILFHERTVNKNKFPNGKTFWQQKHCYNRSTSKTNKSFGKVMSSSKIGSGSDPYVIAHTVRGSVCQTIRKEDFASSSQNYIGSLFWFL